MLPSTLIKCFPGRPPRSRRRGHFRFSAQAVVDWRASESVENVCVDLLEGLRLGHLAHPYRLTTAV